MTTPETLTTTKRKPLLIALGALFATCGVAYAAWWAVDGRYHEHTDNAYVAGNVIQITPQITGTVQSIHADDTDRVEAGKVLVRFDQADAETALAQAEADLAQSVRQVRGLYANDGALNANLAQREAELARAKADLSRRQSLEGTGAVSAEEIQHAREAVNVAESALAALHKQQESSHAQVDNTTLESHPAVAKAAARVREADLALQRTQILAPATGFIAKRNVQVGQKVAPGAPLMALVPLEQVWVDANFKESQLRDMRIGQPVTLTADIYGSSVEYHGQVAGLAAGTGAAFALLPAQNATGNWIKVVQRVPVRIRLDAKELNAHPLRVGLSMEAQVDTKDQSGQQLAQGSQAATVASTNVFADSAKAADERIAAIIAANRQPGAPR